MVAERQQIPNARISALAARDRREAVAQVRLDPSLHGRLDQFVVRAGELGMSGVTRSSVLRAALESFLDDAESELATDHPGTSKERT